MGGRSSPPPAPQILYMPAAPTSSQVNNANSSGIQGQQDAMNNLQTEWARLNRINEATARRVYSRQDPEELMKLSIKTLLGG